MSRFFVPKECVRGREILLTGSEARHIVTVMRLRAKDEVAAFDGTGKEYRGIIRDAGPKSVSIEILDTRVCHDEGKARITLVQAIPKRERMDYIVEKATELGVNVIHPIITERTIVKWGKDKIASHADRWRRIAIEAAKQCGRTGIPVVKDASAFDEAVKDAARDDLALIAALSNDAVGLKQILSAFAGSSLSVIIGPEGDFTPGEIKKAKSLSCKVVSLGARVLKSDTAGLAVLAMVNYATAS